MSACLNDTDGKGAAGMSYPYSVDKVEILDVFGKGVRDDQRDIGAATALVLAQLASQPSLQFLVRLDSQRMMPAGWPTEPFDVRAEFTLGDRLDHVGRESVAKDLLGESVMSLAFDCRQRIEIGHQCCWRANLRQSTLD
jgi:hypothetical protein